MPLTNSLEIILTSCHAKYRAL